MGSRALPPMLLMRLSLVMPQPPIKARLPMERPKLSKMRAAKSKSANPSLRGNRPTRSGAIEFKSRGTKLISWLASWTILKPILPKALPFFTSGLTMGDIRRRPKKNRKGWTGQEPNSAISRSKLAKPKCLPHSEIDASRPPLDGRLSSCSSQFRQCDHPRRSQAVPMNRRTNLPGSIQQKLTGNGTLACSNSRACIYSVLALI
jgi:hypothetical protein